MAEYSPKRSSRIYDPKSTKPFDLSRSKIELFIECPRCFYLDRRLGVSRPPGFPFNLNSAVDALLKKEFDIHRAKKSEHPLLKKYGVDARPVHHEKLNVWRQNFVGIRYLHPSTNLNIFGAIDDLWQNSTGDYIVVDYKATSKGEPITELNQDWHAGYKRQMEIYQWLLRNNDYKVSNTGYFVYCNGIRDKKAFDAKLEFDITLIDYEGSDAWVDDTIKEVKKCLDSNEIPEENDACDYCRYRKAVKSVESNKAQIK